MTLFSKIVSSGEDQTAYRMVGFYYLKQMFLEEWQLLPLEMTVAVYYGLLPPLDQFVDDIPSEIARSRVEEVLGPICKFLFIVEGKAPHMVRQGAEKMVIRRCKVRRIRQM
ncbi:hypothetical protein TNCV_4878351 [Trichonephila clavipes]|nr:hypothetical protein TNCV_4878351 [Trichonephila clavipes]